MVKKRTAEDDIEKPTDGELVYENEFEDDFADEFEHEEIIDAQYEDVEINLEEEEGNTASSAPPTPAPSVFRPGIDQLEEGQTLEPEPGTYTMLHRLDVQWPCLSFDVITPPGVKSSNKLKFPLTSYIVAGTQADKKEKNKIVVMKWSNLQRTNKDGFEDEDDEQEAGKKYNVDDNDDASSTSSNDEDPELEFRMIKHNAGVNRIRAMPQMQSIVASWSDEKIVGVYNIQAEMDAIENGGKAVVGSSPLVHEFRGHADEGYALGWNSHQVGQLATGSCAGDLFLWQPDQGGMWTQNKIPINDFSSVEDIEFKRCGDQAANVFAVCGGEKGRVGLVDVRDTRKCSTLWDAHNGDTNVLSWNPIVGQLLLTGGDDGTFKVWDVRATSRGALANFKWHRAPITSVDWHPTDEAVLAVSSADDSMSIWDMSVEEDNSAGEAQAGGAEYFPPQLLFLHMGQKSIKEIKFHRQLPGVVVSTAFDGFNIFKTFNI
jgi:ribosome assembly protein RRB1